MSEAFPCFCCGQPMQMYVADSGWCDGCQVLERHDPGYIPRTLTWTSLTDHGIVIPFLDHGAGHWPSPA